MCDRASLPVFHMSGELFKVMVGIDVPHVPYSDA
jgi:tripartite-type tricarboxylate transporter receptor subunit TctC